MLKVSNLMTVQPRTITFAPEELGLRKIFKIESPVAAQKRMSLHIISKFKLEKSDFKLHIYLRSFLGEIELPECCPSRWMI
jgi:hypothetical protein